VRQQGLKAVFSLIVLVAVPLLGRSGQAHAGIVTAEMISCPVPSSLLGSSSPWGEWAEQQDAQSRVCLQATEPAIEQSAHGSPADPWSDPASPSLFGLNLPGLPWGARLHFP